MKIVCVEFEIGGSKAYRRMFDVFKKSCAAVMPGVAFEEHLIAPPSDLRSGYSTGMASNVHKLRKWAEVLDAATETVVFCDCDMLALGSVEEVDLLDFDLAYTVRAHGHVPINGGVVFMKPTDAGRAAMRLWNAIDEKMFGDHNLHQAWRRKYAGMNQAAFGYMLEKQPTVARMIPVPCAQYNSCCETWPRIDASTRMVHLKGVLRRGLLANSATASFPRYLQPIAEAWHAYERDGHVEAIVARKATPWSQPFRRSSAARMVPVVPTLDAAAGVAPRRAVGVASYAAQVWTRNRYRRI